MLPIRTHRHARWLAVRPRQLPVGVLLVLGTAASLLCIGLGQVGYWLMLLATLAWLADRAGHATRAGCWLGLLATLKPFYGLFGLYLLWRKDWRAFGGFAATVVVGTAASWLV